MNKDTRKPGPDPKQMGRQIFHERYELIEKKEESNGQ